MPVIPQPYPGSGQNPLVAPPSGSGVVPTPIGSGGSPLDLTTVQYATQVLAAGGGTLTTAQAAILPSLITAASREIIRYCGNRVFPLTTFIEILTPEGMRQDRGEPATAKTAQYPIQDVVSVMTGRQSCLIVINTDTSTNQVAQVAFSLDGDPEFLDLTYTGIVLARWANGAKATDSLSFAGYPTVSALATAINALGNGWSATVAGSNGNVDPGKFPSASLVGVREPKNALSQGACLDLFLQAATGYSIDRSTGILSVTYGSWGTGYGWGGFGGGFGPFGDAWGQGGGWGWGQYRIEYKAGWQTIPENLQQVAAEVVKGMLNRLALNGTMKSQSGGSEMENWSWTAQDAVTTLPDWATQTLNYYKGWSV